MTYKEASVKVEEHDFNKKATTFVNQIRQLYQSCFCAGRFQSGQMGRTVTPLSYDFAGSNPALPTNK